MAALLECLEKKLEPFEEPCDGEGCSSRSHGSSNGKNSSNSKRPSTGKKRQHQSREDEDNDSENDEDENRRNGNGKRTKTSQNDDDQRYACPYYKFDRERFGQMRTCCGPGWSDLHRLK
jgi:hypothetical protein